MLQCPQKWGVHAKTSWGATPGHKGLGSLAVKLGLGLDLATECSKVQGKLKLKDLKVDERADLTDGIARGEDAKL